MINVDDPCDMYKCKSMQKMTTTNDENCLRQAKNSNGFFQCARDDVLFWFLIFTFFFSRIYFVCEAHENQGWKSNARFSWAHCWCCFEKHRTNTKQKQSGRKWEWSLQCATTIDNDFKCSIPTNISIGKYPCYCCSRHKNVEFFPSLFPLHLKRFKRKSIRFFGMVLVFFLPQTIIQIIL